MALFLSLGLLICAVILLFILAWIDLRTGYLPNPYVFLLFCCGLAFHVISPKFYFSTEDIALGALIGAGTLFFIRFIANNILKTDSLGLGDVKLLGAAGIWLGSYLITIALIAGALAGLAHGLIYALYIRQTQGSWPDMGRLSIPAGPGFAFGILIAGGLVFYDLPLEVLSSFH